MTLIGRIRAGVVIMIALLAIGFVFLGNQRQAQALGVNDISGGTIDQDVFCFLDQFPTTDVFNTGCTPTATTGTLTVTKTVTGTTTVPSSDFDIHVMSGGVDIADSPQPGDSSGTAFGDLAAGAYTISETVSPAGISAGLNLSDYTATFSDGCDSKGNVTVVASSSATCTITNQYNTPAPTTGGLVVEKTFDSGTTTPSLFSFTVNSGSPIAFNGSGENDLISEPIGPFTVVEVASSTYTPTYSGCTGTITAGATSTCVITNSLTNSGGGPTTSEISVTKSVDDSTPNIGDTVTYTITASDTGEDASGVVIQDILPSGLTLVSTSSADMVGNYATSTGDWTIGALSSTTPAILHIMATVNSGEDNGTVITNTASVIGGDTSGNANTSSAPITVTIPSNNNNGGGGGGGGGSNPTPSNGAGNGPIAGSFGGGGNGPIVPQGQVLGASTSTVAASCSQYLTGFIRYGAQNDPTQVVKLQWFLDTFDGAKLSQSGTYDLATMNAVKKFQSEYSSAILGPWGINGATGYVYLTTRQTINNIYCRGTKTFPLTAAELAIIASSKTSGTTPHASIQSHAGTGSSSQPSSQAATGGSAGMNMLGTSSAETGAGLSSPTSSPLQGIGNFLRGLFH